MKLKLNDKMPWGMFKDLTIKEVIDTKLWYWKKYGGSLDKDLDDQVKEYVSEVLTKIRELNKSLRKRF